MPAEKTSFAAMGTGIGFAIVDGKLLVQIDMDKKHARPSASGKTNVTASTSGWAVVPGTDFRLNLNAGFRV